jgi:hypothetical protein
VAVYRSVPAPIGAVCALMGVAMMVWGNGHLFRMVSVPLGAFIGATWTLPLLARFGLTQNPAQMTLVATLALALGGAIFPGMVVFLAFGAPLGLLGGQLVGPNDWLLGFAPGFLVGGALGIVFQREVSSVVASLFGAWMLILGSMAALGSSTGVVGFLANNPIPTVSAMGCFALAGSVYQIFVRPSPEERERVAQERFQKKKREAEAKELERRWTTKTERRK